MAVLFFSYSHNDEVLRDRLEVHLAMLKRQGVLETWHDRRIVSAMSSPVGSARSLRGPTSYCCSSAPTSSPPITVTTSR